MIRLAAPLLLLSLTVATAAPAGAVVYGGSNFGNYDYPTHNCGLMPLTPQRPYDMGSVREVDAYNARVDQYNIRLRSFSECVNGYVDNAERDMQRIREKANDAIEEMRRLNRESVPRR